MKVMKAMKAMEAMKAMKAMKAVIDNKKAPPLFCSKFPATDSRDEISSRPSVAGIFELKSGGAHAVHTPNTEKRIYQE